MFDESFAHIVFCGIAGTVLMSGFTYITSLLSGSVMRVTRILGTMLTNQTQAPARRSTNAPPAIAVGVVVHYCIGILFSVLYFFFWYQNIGSPTIISGVLFGAIIGIVAVAAWAFFYRIHPYPPKIPIRLFLFIIFLGHLVFAIGLVLAHKLT